MIEKIASSPPVQEHPLYATVPIPEGKGFAEELAAATTKTPDKKIQEEKPQEDQKDQKNGCCSNSNNDENSASGKPVTSSQGVK